MLEIKVGSILFEKNLFFSALLIFLMNSCIEPFDTEFVGFESVLVIEATITNETKQQKVYLTRTFEFEVDNTTAVRNASVEVTDDMGSTFTFLESEPGIYVSVDTFAALPDRNYKLSISTQDGKSYGSSEMQLTQATQLDNITARRITNDDGIDGIAILADSFDPTGNSVNYRYDYEETYKIIAPKWSAIDLEGDPAGGCGLVKIRNVRDEQICYNTDFSNKIILTNTGDLAEDRVSEFVVRFINRDNYIISHRYSILVRQYIQSNEAYTFYDNLNQFSQSESLFSETQPGFLKGNITSDQDENEKVLGFFDVSSISEKRIFFDYTDFYPNEPLPPYVDPCNNNSPPLVDALGGCLLRPIFEDKSARYWADNSTPGPQEGPFFIVNRVCGDCTLLGKTEIPSFWVE
nr:DUF4249 domain-containing protein [uncultured Allomuricauda sp.]